MRRERKQKKGRSKSKGVPAASHQRPTASGINIEKVDKRRRLKKIWDPAHFKSPKYTTHIKKVAG
jgi:hypothetical protein